MACAFLIGRRRSAQSKGMLAPLRRTGRRGRKSSPASYPNPGAVPLGTKPPRSHRVGDVHKPPVATMVTAAVAMIATVSQPMIVAVGPLRWSPMISLFEAMIMMTMRNGAAASPLMTATMTSSEIGLTCSSDPSVNSSCARVRRSTRPEQLRAAATRAASTDASIDPGAASGSPAATRATRGHRVASDPPRRRAVRQARRWFHCRYPSLPQQDWRTAAHRSDRHRDHLEGFVGLDAAPAGQPRESPCGGHGLHLRVAHGVQQSALGDPTCARDADPRARHPLRGSPRRAIEPWSHHRGIATSAESLATPKEENDHDDDEYQDHGAYADVHDLVLPGCLPLTQSLC